MKTPLNRREMLQTIATTAVVLANARALLAAEATSKKRLGICTYSHNIHWKAAREGHSNARFKDTLEYIDHCHQLGAGGVQVAVGSKENAYAGKVRAKCETYAMYFEGQTSLPKDESDAARFETDIRLAKEAGAEVIRTACLSGRRYETFDSAEAFREFTKRSWNSLLLADPIVKKYRVRLAVENHKDWRVPEFLDLLKRLSSEYVGVTVDTGNNIALLEDGMEVVEALAPFAFSVHLKDMAVQEYDQGFLLSEVPIGEGFLDVKHMIELLQRANPKIQFNLEMITRDPLKIPCLTDRYWATMETTPASQLAVALAAVRRNLPRTPLPKTSGLDTSQQLALEDDHVKKCFAAAPQLGL